MTRPDDHTGKRYVPIQGSTCVGQYASGTRLACRGSRRRLPASMLHPERLPSRASPCVSLSWDSDDATFSRVYKIICRWRLYSPCRLSHRANPTGTYYGINSELPIIVLFPVWRHTEILLLAIVRLYRSIHLSRPCSYFPDSVSVQPSKQSPLLEYAQQARVFKPSRRCQTP